MKAEEIKKTPIKELMQDALDHYFEIEHEINSLKADRLELAKMVVMLDKDVQEISESIPICLGCANMLHYQESCHKPDCIVLKAISIIKENKENGR